MRNLFLGVFIFSDQKEEEEEERNKNV